MDNLIAKILMFNDNEDEKSSELLLNLDIDFLAKSHQEMTELLLNLNNFISVLKERLISLP